MRRSHFDAIEADTRWFQGVSYGECIYRIDLNPADTPLTLLYGRTDDGNLTYHLYLSDGQVHVAMYDYQDWIVRYEARDVWDDAHSLLPRDVLLWPSHCNYAFARLMATKVGPLRFDRWRGTDNPMGELSGLAGKVRHWLRTRDDQPTNA